MTKNDTRKNNPIARVIFLSFLNIISTKEHAKNTYNFVKLA